ncbi:hypothetical protein PAEPH01_2710, partial [Pancytospora epiphaga]
ANLPSDKIILFYNKVKITGSDEMSLSDDKLQITDESVVFVIVLPADNNKSSGEAAKKTAPTGHSHPQQPTGGPMFGMGTATGANPGAAGMNNNMFEQMMKNPEFLNAAVDFAMQNASPEEKTMTKSMMENMKNNPELMQQMFEKAQGMMANGGGMPMMGQYPPNMYMQGSPMHNPMMPGQMGSPMMNGQMGSPMMNGQMGGSPMMNSQMNTPMMNPYPMGYYMNPYMMGQQGYQNMQTPPPNGPCFHGFYPLKDVNGQKVPQNASDVYSEKLKSLNDMGFPDKEANINALIQAKGDLSEAIEILTKNQK